MRFSQTTEGKNVFLSVDSRVTRKNPFYKAWKTKSFTDGDIALHFSIFDILYDPEIKKTLSELIEEIDERLSSRMTFDESTLRKKLKEYDEEGIILIARRKRIRKAKTSRNILMNCEVKDVNDINRLLEKPCFIIDFLPRQVPEDCGGQFFKVEHYLLNNYERYGLRDKYVRIILKLMCYYRVSVHLAEWIEQPTPEQVAEIIDKIMNNHSGWMDMLFPDKDSLLQFEWDCMNLSIYNPDEEMQELLEQITWSEGMFFRKAKE